MTRLHDGLPTHLRVLLHRDVLGTHERDASVDLDSALDLLLSIDRVLCGGSGVVTTRVAAALASRVLSQSAGLVVPGDAVATLSHLQAPFEHPFIDVPLNFSVRRVHDGFVLEMHVPNEPRAARWLGSAGLGYAKAATRFSGEGVARLRLFPELRGDVARVLGRHTDSGVVSTPAPALVSSRDDRARPLRRRLTPTSAAARVDQILSRATPSAGMTAPDPRAQAPIVASTLPSSAPHKPLAHESGTRPALPGSINRSRRSAS